MLAVLCAGDATAAQTVETLKAFLQQTASARARFTQTVLDRNMKKVQEVSGVMQFLRPGRFRWDYEKPYEQLIVGDHASNVLGFDGLNVALTGSVSAKVGGASVKRAALRVVVGGALAMLITYGVGELFGVSGV